MASFATPAERGQANKVSEPAEILLAMDDGYRIFVEAWDPSYGTPLDSRISVNRSQNENSEPMV